MPFCDFLQFHPDHGYYADRLVGDNSVPNVGSDFNGIVSIRIRRASPNIRRSEFSRRIQRGSYIQRAVIVQKQFRLFRQILIARQKYLVAGVGAGVLVRFLTRRRRAVIHLFRQEPFTCLFGKCLI